MNIHIEFCIKWNYGPEFDRVSKIIKDVNPHCSIEGNNIDPRSGAFEIEIDGKLVYSKFETSKFPTEEEIKNFIWLTLFS